MPRFKSDSEPRLYNFQQRKFQRATSQQRGEMKLTEQPDAEVFEHLRQGDSTALGVLYDRYHTPVYRLALRMLGKPSDAEDLTHEVFLLLWQKAAYDPCRGTLLGFLLLLTRSRSINRLRRTQMQNRVTQHLGQGLPAAIETPLLEEISLEETSTLVREALQLIPETQQKILEMTYYDGLSQREIADQLNLPLGTVKSRARQGLLKLKKLLSEWVN
jgi:RNA polymerase sigma-70 factor, ECF subfamily